MTHCSYHHTLTHEGGVGVARLADGSLEWRTPRGTRIDGVQQTINGSAGALIRENTAHELAISAATCDSRWDGLPADYDLVLTAFFSRPEFRTSHASARA